MNGNKAIDTQLLQMANTLMTYGYHIKGSGLMNGKMGIVLFLYAYSRYAGSKDVEEFAGDMLDVVMKDVKRMGADFESGFTGVGWGLRWLFRNGFVEGDMNQILKPIDEGVFSRMDCNPAMSSFGQLVYLADRMGDSNPEYDLRKMVNIVLENIGKGITVHADELQLTHVNAIYYFLNHVRDCGNEKEIKTIERLLSTRVHDMAGDGLRDDMAIPPCSEDMYIQNYIASALREYMFSGKSDPVVLPYLVIEDFVTAAYQRLLTEDMTFRKGFAGLGFILLTNLFNKKNN